MNKQSLKTNAILNTIKTVLSIVFPLITFPYISRVLQVKAVGVYNFSASVVSYFVLIAGLGVATYAVREGAQYRDDKEKIGKFVSEVFTINMMSTLISYLLLVLSIVVISKLHDYSCAIAILSVEIFFTTLGVSWVCNIYEDFLFIAIQSIAVQLVSLLLTFIFIKSPDDIYKYIAVIAFSKSASNIINYIYIRKNYCHFSLVRNCNLKYHLKPILVIFSTSIAIAVYVSADTTMLGFMTDDIQVGLYGTAVKIYTIVKNVLAAVLVVLVPKFSILLHNKNGGEADKLFSKVFNTLVILTFPSVIGLLVTSRDVILLLGGEKYIDGTGSLQLLCFAIAFSLIATLYTSCVLIPKKKEKAVFQATAISAIVNILLNFIFIPWLGINGAAITTIIAEAIVCFMSILYSRRDIRLEGIKKNLLSVSIACAGIAIIGILTHRFIDVFYIRLFVTVVVSVIIYVVSLIVLRNDMVLETVQKYTKRFRAKKVSR